jgi:ABC-type Fe3+/spermidine/putrescine transport system ATPase subunit
MGPILELRGVSKHYAAHRAVNNLTLVVPQGCFFSLLGPSGCGKTTTLRMIAGFEQPDTGEIWLEGERIDQLPPYRRNVNTVFQNYALFPHLTVAGNIEFGLRHSGPASARWFAAKGAAAKRAVRECAAAKETAERVHRILEQVRLSGKESRKPAELSGGERQRVALARALVLEPGVLLLDEPLSALDPQLRKQVRGELRDLQRRSGVTFLFVTHDQEEAMSLSDTLAVMREGELEQTGTPEQLYRRPATRFVGSFLGEMNWLGGARDAAPIGLRPEAVHVSPAACEGARRGSVLGSTFLGPYVRIEVELEGGEALVSQMAANGRSFAAGQPVWVSWSADDKLRFER